MSAIHPEPALVVRGEFLPLCSRRNRGGFALAEVLVGIMVLAITMITTTHAMIVNQRWAAVSRLMTSARTVVQRNIDTALAARFTSTSTPAILATTAAAGAVYDDDGGGDSLVTLSTRDDGTTATVKGTLTRIVTAVANTDGATLRQVTFRLNYAYAGRTYTTEMSTLRTIDD